MSKGSKKSRSMQISSGGAEISPMSMGSSIGDLASSSVSDIGIPDFSDILNDPRLTRQEKARRILEKTGKKGKRQKYATKELRKAAQHERYLKRRADRRAVLEKIDPSLLPKPRGQKLTAEQKKAKRSARGKTKRQLFKDMVLTYPDKAKAAGIDISRYLPKV